MKRFVGVLILFSFSTLAIFEKGMLILCLMADCSLSVPVEAKQEKSECYSCCDSEVSCGQSSSVDDDFDKRDDGKFCSIFIDISESLNSRCDCGLNEPGYMAVIQQQSNILPETEIGTAERLYSGDMKSVNRLANSSRPQGIDKTISTTVLRI
jgi:hypothetical protein